MYKVSDHYCDAIMGTVASQITSLTIVYTTVYSDADQSKHQSSASLAFVWGIHRGPVNSPHKWPVTRKMFPFDDVIMLIGKSSHPITHVSISVLIEIETSCKAVNLPMFIDQRCLRINMGHLENLTVTCISALRTLVQSRLIMKRSNT